LCAIRFAANAPASLVMPEGRKIRKRSDYIFRLSGISRIDRTVTRMHSRAPAFVTPAFR